MTTTVLNLRADLAHEVTRKRYPDYTKVALPEVSLLLEMALEDVYPNGKFSDSECCVWEEMREVLRRHGIIE